VADSIISSDEKNKGYTPILKRPGNPLSQIRDSSINFSEFCLLFSPKDSNNYHKSGKEVNVSLEVKFLKYELHSLLNDM